MKIQRVLAAMVGAIVGGLIMPFAWRAMLSEPFVPWVELMVEHMPVC